jgi:hypothetical protein
LEGVEVGEAGTDVSSSVTELTLPSRAVDGEAAKVFGVGVVKN